MIVAAAEDGPGNDETAVGTLVRWLLVRHDVSPAGPPLKVAPYHSPAPAFIRYSLGTAVCLALRCVLGLSQ